MGNGIQVIQYDGSVGSDNANKIDYANISIFYNCVAVVVVCISVFRDYNSVIMYSICEVGAT